MRDTPAFLSNLISSVIVEKLSGMNESSLVVDIPKENCDNKTLVGRVLSCSNVASLPATPASPNTIYRFSGSAVSSGVPVLITVDVKEGGTSSKVTVNCEKMTINSILAKEIAASVEKVS